VNDALFRREHELTASMAFTTVDGGPVLAGADVYAEKRARWPIEALRLGLVLAVIGVAVAPLVAARHAWRHRGRAGTGVLAVVWTLALGALLTIAWSASTAAVTELAVPGGRALGLFAASVVHPLLAFALLPLTARAWTRGLRGGFALFAAMVALAHTGLAGYLGWWGLVGFRSWTY